MDGKKYYKNFPCHFGEFCNKAFCADTNVQTVHFEIRGRISLCAQFTSQVIKKVTKKFYRPNLIFGMVMGCGN